jgi:sugar transferase (PEP-CTERM/EpsH1 system associated)
MIREKLKILHVLHSFNVGGLENGVINLINNSNEELFVHEICCLTKSGAAEGRVTTPIRIHEMEKRNGNDWRMIPKLAKKIREVKPDILHSRNWGTVDGIVAGRLARVPSIIHGEHGWSMDDPEGLNLRRRLMRRVLSFAVSRYVAVSEDIRKWLIECVGVKDSKVVKILNGVNTEKFQPGVDQKTREQLGFPKDGITIGTVGRLDPIKDQRLLLEAFSVVSRTRKDLMLIIVGDGPERQNLESYRDSLHCRDRIRFLGERDDVERVLRVLDIFVLPSKNEGTSNTTLEAMATGLPVIATAVGGNPELVLQNRTGLLFPAGDLKCLIEALNFYLRDQGHRYDHGLNGRKEVEQRFSLGVMVSNYEELYKSLHSKSHRME